MPDNPTKQDIEDAYAPAFRFLKSVPRIITEGESSSDSESLRLKSEQIKFEIETLKTPAEQLTKLRASASSSLFSLDRLERLKTMANSVGSTGEMERLQKSNVATVELVIILGERLANWLHNLSGIRSPSCEESDDDGGFNEVLERLPSNIASGFGNRYQPPTEDQLAQCSKLLEEEKAIFVANLQKGRLKSTNKKPKKQSKNSKDVLFLSWLMKWHRYETTEFRTDPVKVEGLAEYISGLDPNAQGFSKSSVGRFFEDIFGSHKAYRIACQAKRIHSELERLSNEKIAKRVLSELKEGFVENL